MARIVQPATGIQLAGIRHHQIQTVFKAAFILCGGGHRFRIANIHGNDVDAAGMGGGQFLQRLCRIGLAAGGSHTVTARGGLAGHFQSDATIGTGNQQALGHGSGHFLSGVSGG